MMKFIQSKAEPLLALVAVCTTLALLAVRNKHMSHMSAVAVIGVFAATLLAYAVFVFREQPADEREAELSLVASKYAYLAGAAVLVVGTIVGTIEHTLNPWLPVALTAMVVAKSLAYFVKK